MNCDYVFECLTRGPFPSGRSDDAAVENHLRACHECRRLAHSLQPAVGLFHECMSETADLPSYEGELATAVKILPHESASTSPPKKRGRLSPQFAGVAVALLVAIIYGFFALNQPANQPEASATNAIANSTPAIDLQLASLDLPPQCTTTGDVAESLHCCTNCHNATAAHAEKIAHFARLTSSCMVCHSR